MSTSMIKLKIKALEAPLMLNYALILLIIRTLLLRIDELTKTSVGFMQELTFTGVRGFLKPCKDINLQIMLVDPM